MSGFAQNVSHIAMSIVPRGTGCELTLTHEDVPPEFAERTQAGWTTILEALAKQLETTPGVIKK